jgi:hypothetical protein
MASRQPSGKSLYVNGVDNSGLDDCKFVSTEPSHQIALPHGLSQPASHSSQETVADRVTERIVDILEIVEVKVEDSEPVSAPEPFERFFKPLPEQHPIRQARERVMMRHIHNLVICSLAMADVLVSDDPPAVGHRSLHNVYRAPVRCLEIGARWLV